MTTTAAHSRPERPQGVGPAGPAGADRPRVRAARAAAPRGRRPGSSRRGRRRASGRRSGATSAGSNDTLQRDRDIRRSASRRPESSTGRIAVPAPIGCASRDAARTIDHDDPPAQPTLPRRLRGAPRHPDPWPSARPTTSISSCSARAPAAMRRRSAPPSSASRSPSSTRTRSAARASIAAASRPRRCSSRRPSPSASATPRTTASCCPGDPVVDYAAMAARRDAVVKRMWTGLKTPHRQEQGDLGRRPRAARRSGQGPGQPAGRGRHAGRAAATAS